MSLKNVLIVDDEYIGREMLRDSICWEDYGYTVSGEAHNGLEALKIIASDKPDVLFTDIRMPGIDGIELIQRVHKRYGNGVRCVAISGYEDFAYVRCAFREGAVDYLTKHTFLPEDVVAVLEKLNEMFHRDRNRELGENAIQRQKYLSMVFSDSAGRGGRLRWNRSKPVTYAVFALSVGNQRRLAVMCRQIERNGDAPKCLLATPNDRLAICLYRIPTASFEDGRQKIIRTLTELCREVLDSKRFIGVSDPFSDESDMHEAYMQVLHTMNYSIYCSRLDFLCYEQCEQFQRKAHKPRRLLDVDHIRILLKTLAGRVSAEEEITAIFRDNALLDPRNENLINCYREMLTQIYALGREENQPAGESVRQCYEELRARADADASVYQLEGNLLRLLACVVESKRQGQQYGMYITMAIRYIEENISDKLSLNAVADAIGISRIYLSQLFRKETQTTYSQYVLERRIEMARWLLRNTNKKVYEVSHQVGFNEVHHFSLKFKECTGVSPNDYRRGVPYDVDTNGK